MTFGVKDTETKLTRTDAFYLFLVLLLVSLVYLPQLFLGQTSMDAPQNMNISTMWFPGYKYGASSYHDWFFPLWYPYPYCGMPGLGYMYGGALYIPNILMFTLLDTLDAATLTQLCHSILAALGFFVLFRDMRISPLAAFLAVITFSVSGFFFYQQCQTQNHIVTAWLPVFLFGLRRVHLRPRIITTVLLAMTTAMMFLGGDPEVYLANMIFIFLFIVILLRKEAKGSTFRTLLLTGFIVGLGTLVCMAQMTPTLEILENSIRSSKQFINIEFTRPLVRPINYLPFIFFPLKSFSRLFPTMDFNNGLAPFYLGILPVAGAAYSLWFYRRDPVVKALWQIAVILTCYLFAREFDLTASLFESIPVIGKLKTHERWVQIIQLPLLMLAAYAFDYFRRNFSEISLKIFSGAMAAWGIATLVIAPMLIAVDTRYLLGALMIFFGITGVFMGGQKNDKVRLAAWFVSILVICDVYLLSLAAVPRISKALFELDPAVDAFLEQQDPTYRFTSFEKIGPGTEHGALFGLIPGHRKIGSPCGDNRLLPYKYYEFLYILDPKVAIEWGKYFRKIPLGEKYFFTADLLNPDYLNKNNIQLLDMLAVRYIFSRGISLEFASPYSLMHRKSLTRGHWLTFPVERNPYGSGAKADYFHQDRGRRALKVPLPYRAEFIVSTSPGDELAFEVKPWSSVEPGEWRIAVKVSAARAGAYIMTPLVTRSFESSAGGGQEFPVRVPLEGLGGGYVRLNLEISGEGPEANAVIVDARLIRKDAPFQRVEAGSVDIFINQNALPRAFLVHEAETMSLEQMREVMIRPERFDSEMIILLEKGRAPEEMVAAAEGGTHSEREKEYLKIINHGSEKVSMQAELSYPGWLFLSDVYFPGWKARVDNRETRIYRANYAFRAVLLPAGVHNVMFQYQPASFRIGLWVSLASLFQALAVGVATAIRKKRS